jgi:hypothetical protein
MSEAVTSCCGSAPLVRRSSSMRVTMPSNCAASASSAGGCASVAAWLRAPVGQFGLHVLGPAQKRAAPAPQTAGIRGHQIECRLPLQRLQQLRRNALAGGAKSRHTLLGEVGFDQRTVGRVLGWIHAVGHRHMARHHVAETLHGLAGCAAHPHGPAQRCSISL